MKKILVGLVLFACSVGCFAKQKVEYYRYNLSMNIAQSAEKDLEKLIASGNKIVSFSLDYAQKCMLVVYDDGN